MRYHGSTQENTRQIVLTNGVSSEYKYYLNKVATYYKTAAEYLSHISINRWITFAICDELLKRNPDGGGGTFGWRTNNMSEGSFSRNKPWRSLHVLHFFHNFVQAFSGWMDYIQKKQTEWRHKTLTPCAQRQLEDASKEAVFRTGKHCACIVHEWCMYYYCLFVMYFFIYVMYAVMYIVMYYIMYFYVLLHVLC